MDLLLILFLWHHKLVSNSTKTLLHKSVIYSVLVNVLCSAGVGNPSNKGLLILLNCHWLQPQVLAKTVGGAFGSVGTGFEQEA